MYALAEAKCGTISSLIFLEMQLNWILINIFLLEHKGRMRDNFNYTSDLSLSTVPFLLHNSDRPRQLLKALYPTEALGLQLSMPSPLNTILIIRPKCLGGPTILAYHVVLYR